MFETSATPDSAHLVWLFFFALAVAGASIVLRKLRPSGFSWWLRTFFLILCVFIGHAIQAVTPLRGMPGIPSLMLFPIVPSSLSSDYYLHFRDAGMGVREAYALGTAWGYKHGFVIWFIVAAMVFFWVWLRPSKCILHGDEQQTDAS